MKTNLNKELERIVNKYVKIHKDDLERDIDILLDKNKMSDTFIFSVREAGTNLYEKCKLFVNKSGEREDIFYYENKLLKTFEIQLSKRGKKYIYGDIKEISTKLLLKDIKNNSKSFNKVSVRFVKNDDSALDSTFLNENVGKRIPEFLFENKISNEDLKRVYFLEYFN